MELKSVKVTFIDGSIKRFSTYDPYKISPTPAMICYDMIGHGGVKASLFIIPSEIRSIEVFDSENDELMCFTPA